MRKQARLLCFSIACVSSIFSFGCGGGSQGSSNSALTSDGTPPLVCEAGWDHPIQCEIVRPDGIKESFGGSGDRFHACEPGQTTRRSQDPGTSSPTLARRALCLEGARRARPARDRIRAGGARTGSRHDSRGSPDGTGAARCRARGLAEIRAFAAPTGQGSSPSRPSVGEVAARLGATGQLHCVEV
jgi:hypothetical protein